jgi:hypothetical protein
MAFLADNNNNLGESQRAFRRDRSIEDHLFTLNGICSLRKASKLKTYTAFLDLSKQSRLTEYGEGVCFTNFGKMGFWGKCGVY